jgi:ethanolamine utilization protein EutA
LKKGAKVMARIPLHHHLSGLFFLFITPIGRKILADRLAEILFEFILQKRWSQLTRSLMMTSGLNFSGSIDLVCYSGGVAEFIYDKERQNFGDLGILLGQSIRNHHQKWGVELGFPLERICATVIGASQYTVQISGNTIFLSNPEILPIRNLPVVKLPVLSDHFEQADVIANINNSFELIGLTEGNQNVALGVTWNHEPDYFLLNTFAIGLINALPKTISNSLPVILVFDNDVAGLVGHLLSDIGVSPLISIDNINIGQLSYIDIGRRLSTTHAVPVTVKSLIFR